jgi:hypothetical protein
MPFRQIRAFPVKARQVPAGSIEPTSGFWKKVGRSHILVPSCGAVAAGLACALGWLPVAQLPTLLAASIALFGYMLTAHTNRETQARSADENLAAQARLQKRQVYADLMESLLLFKDPARRKQVDMDKLGEVYYRSWVEASDKVWQCFDAYWVTFEAFLDANRGVPRESAGPGSQADIARQAEMDAFDRLVNQMRADIQPGATGKFVARYIQAVPEQIGDGSPDVQEAGNRLAEPPEAD